MAVYNQHLLLSGTPVLKYKERRWQHSPMADTPRSNASSTYDLEDSFLAAGGHVTALHLTICCGNSVYNQAQSLPLVKHVAAANLNAPVMHT